MGLIDHPGYEVETEEGPMWVRPLDRLVAEEKHWRAMGVKNTCPECGQECAMFLGDPDGAHWCLMCHIRKEADALPAEAEQKEEQR